MELENRKFDNGNFSLIKIYRLKNVSPMKFSARKQTKKKSSTARNHLKLTLLRVNLILCTARW